MERRVICRRDNILGEDLSFFLRARYGDGKVYLGKPPELEEQTTTSEVFYPTPTFILRPEEAQVLMDSMWDCGLRPTEGSGSAGAMAATQRHLEDMRTLVFNPPK